MLLDLIKTRQSVRKYQKKDISSDDLRKILLAGNLAPSWMNSQPWKFILVKNQQTKDLLSALSLSQPQVKNAPAIIVCIADKNGWSKEEFGEVLKSRGMTEAACNNIFSNSFLYPAINGENVVLARTLEQLTYPIAYMMLTAADLGISSCIVGAIANELTSSNPELERKAKETLNLKDGQIINSIITLGYASEETPVDKTRKEFNDVVHFEKIGQNF